MYNVCLYQFTFGGQLNIHIVILEINFRLVCVCVQIIIVQSLCNKFFSVGKCPNKPRNLAKLIIIFRKYTNIEAFDLLTWALFGLRLNVNRLTSIDLEQEMYTTFIDAILSTNPWGIVP